MVRADAVPPSVYVSSGTSAARVSGATVTVSVVDPSRAGASETATVRLWTAHDIRCELGGVIAVDAGGATVSGTSAAVDDSVGTSLGSVVMPSASVSTNATPAPRASRRTNVMTAIIGRRSCADIATEANR